MGHVPKRRSHAPTKDPLSRWFGPPPRERVPSTLDGKLFALNGTSLALFTFRGSPHLFLACFSTEKQLRAMHVRAGVAFTAIKRIHDGRDFLERAPRRVGDSEVKVVLDPRQLASGKMRWMEMLLP